MSTATETMPTDHHLQQLLSHRDGPCISLYMPVDLGPDRVKNPIRLKNLLRRCDERLVDLGIAEDARRVILKPLVRGISNEAFFREPARGLALFRSRTFYAALPLPTPVTEAALVDDRFHIKPLLAFAGSRARFYVLALQLGRVRLFEGHQHALVEVDLDDVVPQSLGDAVSVDGDKTLQFHTVNQGHAADPIYHGQGAGRDVQTAKIRRFFRIVDDKLQTYVSNAPGPVVLVGPEHLVPIFRDASRKLDLVTEAVMKNPEGMTTAELLAAAWPLAAARVDDERAALTRAKRLEGSDLVSHDLEEVVVAATDGRIEALFIPRDDHQWGEFDPKTRRVKRYDDKRDGADDLFDVAATSAYLTGASVFLVDPSQLPGRASVTGVFRYDNAG